MTRGAPFGRSLCALAFAISLAGCGDERSQIYVVNRDDIPYHIAFAEQPDGSDRIEGFIASGKQGLLLDYPGVVNGHLELRGADCALIQDATISGGRTLVSIQFRSLKVEANADLSKLPVENFPNGPSCPAS